MDTDGKSKIQGLQEFLGSPAARAVLAAVPVAGVNVVATTGQFLYLRAHLAWLPGAAFVAAVMESIAVYLAWHAHLAALMNDSAMRLRLAAYTVAAGIGLLNYSHFAGPGWRPTVLAVMFALASVLSPWLWGVHTRRQSRDRLMERGLIDEHALRLGATRWAWHPLRSPRLMFHATWYGTTSFRDALALVPKFAGDVALLPARPGTDGPVAPAKARTAPPRAKTALPKQPAPPAAPPVAPPPAPEVPASAPDLDGLEEEARQWLSRVPLDQLPAERVFARDHLGGDGSKGTPDRRRIARRMLADRRASVLGDDGSGPPDGPVREAERVLAGAERPRALIATPGSFLPGGQR